MNHDDSKAAARMGTQPPTPHQRRNRFFIAGVAIGIAIVYVFLAVAWRLRK
jgi:hypothetical protein